MCIFKKKILVLCDISQNNAWYLRILDFEVLKCINLFCGSLYYLLPLTMCFCLAL